MPPHCGSQADLVADHPATTSNPILTARCKTQAEVANWISPETTQSLSGSDSQGPLSVEVPIPLGTQEGHWLQRPVDAKAKASGRCPAHCPLLLNIKRLVRRQLLRTRPSTWHRGGTRPTPPKMDRRVWANHRKPSKSPQYPAPKSLPGFKASRFETNDFQVNTNFRLTSELQPKRSL